MILSPQSETLARIEDMLEKIYDTLQEIREGNAEDWFTSEIQMEVKQAQAEAKRGEYTEFDNASDLISHLHKLNQNEHVPA